jgi:glycosyltransferase involved in cell wall biosynthesis
MKILPISVIIPVFNAGEFLEQCVNSINSKTIPTEIILIDDCSTDNSLDVAISISKTHTNVRILKTEMNVGATEARKMAILASKQDLIALVDADDFIEDGAMEDAFNRLVEDIDLVIWELWKYEIDGIQRRGQANPDSFPVSGSEALLLSLGGWRIHPLGVARKQVYLIAYEGFYCDSFNSDELITRLVLKGCRSISGSNKKYFYRTNPNSTTQTVSDRHLTSLRSYLWLLKLCLYTKNAPTASVVLDGIYSAFNFFKKRKLYTKEKLNEEIFAFIKSSSKIIQVWETIIFKPKYLIAFFILFIYSANQRMLLSLKKMLKHL